MVSRIEVHSEDVEREHASFPMTMHCDDANAMMQTNRAMLEIPRDAMDRYDHAENAHQSCMRKAPWGILFLATWYQK